MIIETIKKKGESNVTITFDSGENLTISYEIFLKRGLKKNSELSEPEAAALLEDNEKYLLKQNAFRFLNRRIHSESELKEKLLKKGFKPIIVDEVLQSLKKSGYLEDKAFAISFIEEKRNRYGWGNQLIIAGLRKKGIDREIISELLLNIPAGDLQEKAIKLLSKKYRSKQIDDPKSIKYKMFNYLHSKGYDFEISEQAVTEYLRSRDLESI